MGEARRRGTREDRARDAIRRNKADFARSMGLMDAPGRVLLQAGLKPFLDSMSPSEWADRRAAIVDSLKEHPAATSLSESLPVRVQNDEMGWYLFLCQQAIEDPLCTEINQAQRALPFFAGLGARWPHAHRVTGLDRKIKALLKDYRKEPDGLLFEILVALSYATSGWDVTFIEEGDAKSADMHVARADQEFFVECKRMSRRTEYSKHEQREFLRLWDAGKALLVKNGQWIWFKGTFHVDPAELQDDFLYRLWTTALPISAGEHVLLDNPEATIQARLIDRGAVHRHMQEYFVKGNSPMLTHLIGGDWAPDNAPVTLLHAVKTNHVAGCEAPVLATYIDEVGFACGFTRDFDSEASIDKRAKDVIKLLSDAVKQVPADKPSIIHIAAETMEGAATERRRSQKIQHSIPGFITDKPVVAIRFHRLQAHRRTNLLYEMDETVDYFQTDAVDLSHLPTLAVVVADAPVVPTSHWELYPDGQ
ncbi:hypothetical protein [Burkholderia gladioli]|uniref:hypothetical protein n=1 Tax=Burkholderia gladioli TaxID=28095 RepID=UPI0016415F25|nr:hypothetical protein [Burkholderia gladioli]